MQPMDGDFGYNETQGRTQWVYENGLTVCSGHKAPCINKLGAILNDYMCSIIEGVSWTIVTLLECFPWPLVLSCTWRATMAQESLRVTWNVMVCWKWVIGKK
jgi:hypothetical protein